MFQTKKKKIAQYLNGLDQPAAFDLLLRDYVTGQMVKNLQAAGIQKPDIHIDWLKDYQCIGIQGRSGRFYLDIQIEPGEFSIGCGPDEPDDHRIYQLDSGEQFYTVIRNICTTTA